MRSRLIGALERFPHVGSHWTRHKQHIGMARGCDKANPEPLEIVQDVVESVYLELAAIAGARIYLANGKRSPQPPAGRAVNLRRQFGHRSIVSERGRFGKRSVHQALQQ
jgi:hypothetical protein